MGHQQGGQRRPLSQICLPAQAPPETARFGMETVCWAILARYENDAVMVRARKMLNFKWNFGSGGGIRTPDTRIMIPLL